MRRLKDRIAQAELAEQDDRELVSRSDRKKTRTGIEDAIAGLGEQLVVLNARQLSSLGLPEAVGDVLRDAQLIKSPIARARQMRLVRRELRAAKWEEIQEMLSEYLAHGFPARPKANTVVPGGPLDVWLSALLTEGDVALQRFLSEVPGVDRVQLRTCLRNYEKSKGASRESAKQKLIRLMGSGDS